MSRILEDQDIAALIRIGRLRHELVSHEADLKEVEHQMAELTAEKSQGYSRRDPYDLQLLLTYLHNKRGLIEKTLQMDEIEERLRRRGIVPPERRAY